MNMQIFKWKLIRGKWYEKNYLSILSIKINMHLINNAHLIFWAWKVGVTLSVKKQYNFTIHQS